MANYNEHALDGASPVDLVVALYDGVIRFLYSAIAAVEKSDIVARRIAVKRALAILIHLQARLRMDIGGRPAEVLSEFYAAMFALILQASLSSSSERFEEAIGHVKIVRDAWREVAADPSLGHVAASALPPIARIPVFNPPAPEVIQATRWTA